MSKSIQTGYYIGNIEGNHSGDCICPNCLTINHLGLDEIFMTMDMAQCIECEQLFTIPLL